MPDRIGGTIEDMTKMGSQFNHQADALGSLVTRITSELNSTDWTGGAATRFREQWNGEFKGVFTKVEAGLRNCGTEIKSRAAKLSQADA